MGAKPRQSSVRSIRQSLGRLEEVMRARFPTSLAPMLRTQFSSGEQDFQAGEKKIGRSFSPELRQLLAWSDGADVPDKGSHSLLHLFDEWDLMGLHDIVDDVLYLDKAWNPQREPFLSSSSGFVCLDWGRQGAVVEVDEDGELCDVIAPNLSSFLERWIRELQTRSEDDIDSELRELELDLV